MSLYIYIYCTTLIYRVLGSKVIQDLLNHLFWPIRARLHKLHRACEDRPPKAARGRLGALPGSISRGPSPSPAVCRIHIPDQPDNTTRASIPGAARGRRLALMLSVAFPAVKQVVHFSEFLKGFDIGRYQDNWNYEMTAALDAACRLWARLISRIRYQAAGWVALEATLPSYSSGAISRAASRITRLNIGLLHRGPCMRAPVMTGPYWVPLILGKSHVGFGRVTSTSL